MHDDIAGHFFPEGFCKVMDKSVVVSNLLEERRKEDRALQHRRAIFLHDPLEVRQCGGRSLP